VGGFAGDDRSRAAFLLAKSPQHGAKWEQKKNIGISGMGR
jgi:hypothetical protein